MLVLPGSLTGTVGRRGSEGQDVTATTREHSTAVSAWRATCWASTGSPARARRPTAARILRATSSIERAGATAS
ncbi:hypothetical protein ACFQ0B_51880 [Nonomuraea thailandensis]